MNEQILQMVYSAIDRINRQNPDSEPVEKDPSTILYGSKSKLDSLSLINLIVNVEQLTEERFHVPITLADERALSQAVSPFSTVEALATYIDALLKEKADA